MVRFETVCGVAVDNKIVGKNISGDYKNNLKNILSNRIKLNYIIIGERR